MIEPLTNNPYLWSPEAMWRWVNEVDAARRAGAIADGVGVPAVAAANGSRPVVLSFSRSSLVEMHGWSSTNHDHDERIDIDFRADVVILQCCTSFDKILIARTISLLAICCLAEIDHPIDNTRIEAAVGDISEEDHMVCFSSSNDTAFMVPDPYFVLTRSYERERSYIETNWKDYADRDPRAYWRGSPTGVSRYDNHFDSPRVKLVSHSNDPRSRYRFNVRFSTPSGLDDSVISLLSETGGFSSPEDQMNITEYKFNLDVDGVSTAWTGLFLKLLCGAPVMKILSEWRFSQWYYPLIRQWVHYAPVKQDLSNLQDVYDLLVARPDLARSIGDEGRKLAISLSLSSQLDFGVRVLRRAARSPRAARLS